LLDAFLALCAEWSACFSQDRTLKLAIRQAIGALLAPGRKTISRFICAVGRDQEPWSSEYRLFSRAAWEVSDLFLPAIQHTLPYLSGKYISILYDDTSIKRTGRKIPGAQYLRDPLSPPFHTNFIYGLRYAQASVVVPLYAETQPLPPRAVPIHFSHAPVVKKPGKRASEAQRLACQEARKQQNLSTQFVRYCAEARKTYDAVGCADRVLLMVGDGSYCNRTTFRMDLPKVRLLVRCRKNARLCLPAPKGSRRYYGQDKFTPEQTRTDEELLWQKADLFVGGQFRSVRYKELHTVLWQRGAKRKPLRLLVLAGTPYRTTKTGKTYYREPAYLLCDDHEADPALLLQAYFDRWQIEINHRDEKDVLGVGQAQVWAEKSVPRQPAFIVAIYSLLLLAGLEAFGPHRTHDYIPLPKWRRNADRPSCLDLVSKLRQEVAECPRRLEACGIRTTAEIITSKAAA
jgi:hypothetical protein